MIYIVIAMLLILAVSGLVITYVAYPHRGEQVPKAPWLGDAMTRAVERAPVLKDEDGSVQAHLLHR